MICQKKNKKLCVFCLFCLLLCLVVQCSVFCVPSYASETTTQSVSDYFTEHDFYDTCAYVCRKYASFPYMDYITGANSGITYDAWLNYLSIQDKLDLLNEDVTITGSGGGRGYDIPQDVRQEMLNFVQNNYVNEQNLGYVECRIYSYNYLSPNIFSTYQQYNALKDYIAQSDSPVVVNSYTNPNGTFIFCYKLDRSQNLNYVGSVSGGSFTNVHAYYNWSIVSSSDTYNKVLQVNANGTMTTYPNGILQLQNYTLLNNTMSSVTGSNFTIFSNQARDEWVYVFNNVNALKNYNSAYAQPYYLPSNSQTTVPFYDGFTQGDLNQAGNFYNNIVVNTSGDSPSDIKKKTDSVLGSLDGLLSNDDSDSSTGILGGLADIITGATGAITPIKELINDDLKQFVSDIFDWLPASVVSLWIAGITFGVFFGVLKVIRG